MNNFKYKPLFAFISFGVMAVFVSAPRAVAQAPLTQEVGMNAGWNLISIQVGETPLAVGDFEAALDEANNLIEVWGYTPSGDPNVPGSWNTYQPKIAGYPNDLASLEQGKGYWVNVSQVTTFSRTDVPWDGSLNTVTGWNLLGFPGVAFAVDESQELDSVFGADFDRVTQVWTFDSASQQNVGYDITAIPIVKDLGFIEPGKGYWVYTLEPLTIDPDPFVALVGDPDSSPLQPEELFSAVDPRWLGANPTLFVGMNVRFRGAEDVDFDLNGNGLIDSAFTQDTIRFETGVDRKVISLGNTAGGIVNWSIDNAIPWLSFDVTAGVASSEIDHAVLTVDRAGLLPGTITGQSFTIYIGDLTKVVNVVLDVSTAAGDWKGFATTTRVNGKSIPLGKVDLALNLFMNSEGIDEKGFRAVLNRDLSLLFPRDVFMNGIFFSGNDFSLTTNFEMPAGDRNAPPFDVFTHTTSGDPEADARGDKDYDGDGVLDVFNPFAFPIQREVTLLGSRTGPNRLEGSFIEAITGLLPNDQAIFIEGSFQLDRRTLEPTKRSIFNQTVNPVLPIGGSSGQPFREGVISVGEAVSIQGVSLTLDIDFLDPTILAIRLTAPTGEVVTLHDGGDTLPAALSLADFNGLDGMGDWTLRIEWDPASGERGFFNGWGLDIEGLATYAVSGTIVGDTGGGVVPVEGANLVLSGSNLIEQQSTDINGAFQFPDLTENSYTLSISAAGFETRNVAFFLGSEDVDLGTLPGIDNGSGQIELTPVDVPDAILKASPPWGAEPLHVDFSFLVPLPQLVSEVGSNATTVWAFGDGSPFIMDTASADDEITLTAASHVFTEAGTFMVTAVMSGDSGFLLRQAEVLVHRTRPDPAGPAQQLVGVSYVGSMAAPLTGVGPVLQLSGGSTVASYGIINTSGGTDVLSDFQAATIYQESKRDSAAFDTDRFPKIVIPADFHPNQEDTDFFTQVGTLFDMQSPEPADSQYSTYEQPTVGGTVIPDRFRVITALGGYVFGVETGTNSEGDPILIGTPSRVGDFQLQGGRVEPEPGD